MATADALVMARMQFAANMTFHILFPAISIGLSWLLLYFRLRANSSKAAGTGDTRWLQAYKFWVKVFALSFALGVVSGVTLSFQFGTNWPGYLRTVGNIAGPLLSYEILTAFMLEAAFLGVMLFGGERVPPRLHAVAATLVAVGTTLSAFWILALDSWMQTPAGFVMIDGQAHAASWLAVIFNPSFPYRLTHMLLASGLTVSFLVAGISAYRWLRGQRGADVQVALRTAVLLAAVLIPLQIAAGDQHGLNTLEHQPAKVMAMEGHFQSHPDGAPLVLFGIPDQEAGTVRHAIEIPKASSLILKHDLNAPMKGLDTVPRENWPYVPLVFWSFRVMVGLGFLMLGLGVFSVLARLRGKLYDWRPLHWYALAMGPAGFVAVIAGWVTTEAGRQPFTVYGLLRTAASASPLEAPAVAASLLSFIAVYFIVFGAGTGYILKLMSKPPHPGETGPEVGSDNVIRTAGITPAPALDPGSTIGAR
jgi:cytochrome d ubiquinol oxidase subunit I